MAIDRKDNLSVIFRDVNSSGYVLYFVRHENRSDWSVPKPFYTTDSLIQDAVVKTDNKGDVVVAFWQPDNGSGSVSTTVYNHSTDQWEPAAQISPLGSGAIVPTLV